MRASSWVAGWMAVAAFSGCGASEPRFVKRPYLQDVRDDSVLVAWETSAPCNSRVRFGESGLDRVIEDGEPKGLHRVRLPGLRAGADYVYQVESCGLSGGAPARFGTAPRPGTPYRIAVWGDNQGNPWVFRQVAAAMAARAPRLMVAVGDVVEDGKDYQAWGKELFEPLGELAARAPFFVAHGNHDGCSAWEESFVARPTAAHYFAVSYGDARLAILDTELPLGPGSDQLAWLQQETASTAWRSAAFRLVFMHKPLHAECWDDPGYEGEAWLRPSLQPLLESSGADVVFAGHTHAYERGALNGVTYVITGGGGGRLDSFQRDLPQVAVSAPRHHFVLVEVGPEELRLQAVDPGSGAAFDAVALPRRPPLAGP